MTIPDPVTLFYLCVFVGVPLSVWVFRHVLRWMEDRGHLIISEVTDRRRAMGNAMLSVEELVNPSARHVLETRNAEDLQALEDKAGDGNDGNATGESRRLRQRRSRQGVGHELMRRPEQGEL